jgi:hypothetical protein
MRHGLLAAFAALLAAGCGAARTQPGLTKAQFIAGADAICRAEQVHLYKVATARGGSLGSLRAGPGLIKHAVAIHETANARLEALPEPPRETGPIERWLTARTVATTVESDAAQALAGKDPAEAGSVQRERDRTSALARSLALAYGARVCAETE